ncbi:MAG: hypothetical protein AB1374_00685 [Bacillota bacterium]
MATEKKDLNELLRLASQLPEEQQLELITKLSLRLRVKGKREDTGKRLPAAKEALLEKTKGAWANNPEIERALAELNILTYRQSLPGRSNTVPVAPGALQI